MELDRLDAKSDQQFIMNDREHSRTERSACVRWCVCVRETCVCRVCCGVCLVSEPGNRITVQCPSDRHVDRADAAKYEENGC